MTNSNDCELKYINDKTAIENPFFGKRNEQLKELMSKYGKQLLRFTCNYLTFSEIEG